MSELMGRIGCGNSGGVDLVGDMGLLVPGRWTN